MGFEPLFVVLWWLVFFFSSLGFVLKLCVLCYGQIGFVLFCIYKYIYFIA
jgi:hypothetical protein